MSLPLHASSGYMSYNNIFRIPGGFEALSLPFEALSLRAEREKEPNLDAVVPREDRGRRGGRFAYGWPSKNRGVLPPKRMVKIMGKPY